MSLKVHRKRLRAGWTGNLKAFLDFEAESPATLSVVTGFSVHGISSCSLSSLNTLYVFGCN